MNYKILISGDSAITLEFGKTIDPATCTRARAVRKQIENANIYGVNELVQTYCSVMVHYNPLLIDHYTLSRELEAHLQAVDMHLGEHERIIMDIPVCYGGEFGPDLDTVCKHTGLSREEVIALHSEPEYQIYMMGFLPGFVYLGGMNPKLETPRLSSPRTQIDAGSIGIAARQTGIYPLTSPGGWQIIGRTPIRPYDHDRENPILYESGEYLHFVPITEKRFYEIQELVNHGQYQYKWRSEV